MSIIHGSNVEETGLGVVRLIFEDSQHCRAVADLFAAQSGDVGFQADAAALYRAADTLDDDE